MSGVAIVRALMVGHAPLTAQVQAARIVAGDLKQGTTLPAISITLVSGVEGLTVAMTEAGKLVTERVQVTVLASSYPSLKNIIGLVRAALPHTRGAVAGFTCDSILPAGDGPDGWLPEESIYDQPIDFTVRFAR